MQFIDLSVRRALETEAGDFKLVKKENFYTDWTFEDRPDHPERQGPDNVSAKKGMISDLKLLRTTHGCQFPETCDFLLDRRRAVVFYIAHTGNCHV